MGIGRARATNCPGSQRAMNNGPRSTQIRMPAFRPGTRSTEYEMPSAPKGQNPLFCAHFFLAMDSSDGISTVANYFAAKT